jgi:hypothetical protein
MQLPYFIDLNSLRLRKRSLIALLDRGVRIYLDKALMNILKLIILPFIVPSMKYKLGV